MNPSVKPLLAIASHVEFNFQIDIISVHYKKNTSNFQSQ